MNDSTFVPNSIIDGFYDASAQPELWPRAWAAAVASLGGTTGSLVVQQLGSDKEPITMPGFSDTAIQLYFEHFHTVDVWAEFLKRDPSLRGFLGQELIPAEQFARTEVWNDFSKPHLGSFHLVGSVIPIRGFGIGYVGIHRPHDAPEFDETERVAFEKMLPHVQRALELRHRFGAATESQRIGFAALDLMDFGVAVVQANGNIVFANAALNQFRAYRDGLMLGRAGIGLTATNGTDTKKLRALILDAAHGGPGGATQLRRETRAPLIALVSRLPESFTEARRSQGLVLVAVHDPETRMPDLGLLLSQAFGLTRAEADLVQSLSRGDRLQEICDERGTRISTARSQLRSILAKTGTTRQAELLRLISRLSTVQPRTPPA